MYPEARPSGVFRSVEARKQKNAIATVWLVGFSALAVAAALYVVLG